MGLMSLEEKARNLQATLAFLGLLGFKDFEMLPLAEAESRFGKESCNTNAPAFYLPQHRIGVIDLESIREDQSTTIHISFYVAHELSHFLVHRFLESKGVELLEMAKEKASHLGVAEDQMNDWEFSFNGLHEGFPEFFETLTNSLAYSILFNLELLKLQVIFTVQMEKERQKVNPQIIQALNGYAQGAVQQLDIKIYELLSDCLINPTIDYVNSVITGRGYDDI